MASETKPQIDPVTGATTTGHEWDGLQELNIPLPRWWLWIFYATIVWAIGYWIVYPAWPMLTSYSKGALGWQSRDAVVADLIELKAKRGPLMEKLAKASVTEISADRELSDFARAVGKPAFAENCAPCHGAGGGGAKGYPNLNDDDWLWGGKLDDILLTIRHGVRAADDKTRAGAVMPAFGRDGMLTRDQISSVADYVRYVAKLSDAKIDVEKGKKIYMDNCAVCHGEDAKGKRDLGSPNLTDAIWLYGSSKEVIVEGLTNGRGGLMPAWAARLDDTTIKALAIYVQGFGGGEK
ncbi:MAG: cytochrome-c oxidase, cbb3-type subunit III [Xanthobacteraceae bacterium]